MAERRAPLPSERGPLAALGAWLLAIVGASLGLVVFALLAPVAPLDPAESEAAALVAYGIGYACASALVLGVSILAPRDARTAIGIGTAGALALIAVALSGVGVGPLGSALVLAALLALGTGLGAGIGGRIQHAGHLSIVAIVSSIADIASVLAPGGPSHQIADSPALLSLLALSWPMVGTTQIEPLLGVGDVAFVALYVAACGKHGLSRLRTNAALALALVVTAVVVALTELPIPALPFLGASIVIAHPAARLPPAPERRKAFLALVVFAVLFGTLVIVRWSG